MERELSREEVEAQIEEQQRRISERVNVIEHEARFLGQTALDQVNRLKDQAIENLPIVGGAVLGVGVLLPMLFGRKKSSDSGVVKNTPMRFVSDEFAASLTRSIQHRIDGGQDLQSAIRDALTLRTPVLLRAEPTGRSGGKGLGWLLGLGFVAAAGFAADFAVRTLYGKNLADWIMDTLAGIQDEPYPEDRYEESRPESEAYPPVPGDVTLDDTITPPKTGVVPPFIPDDYVPDEPPPDPDRSA